MKENYIKLDLLYKIYLVIINKINIRKNYKIIMIKQLVLKIKVYKKYKQKILKFNKVFL
jgi:hypothetical protein